jgi:HlyD family secretion protein
MTPEPTDISALRIRRDRTDPGTARKIPWKVVIPLSIVALLTLGILFRGHFERRVDVELASATLVSPGQASSLLTANGYVVAQVKAAVASKATGRLEELLVEEGDRVRRGAVIGRLEDGDVAAALEQARANLAVARADSFDARQALGRQRTLFASGLTSQMELDGAEARFNRVSASILAAQAAVTAAAVALESTRIRAPFDGTVLTKNADVGEVVAPFGASSNSKGAVVTMADMSSLQVEADVSESNIMRVKTGQPCEIVLDAYPDRRYQGRVHKIVPTADRAKATVMTKVAFLDRDDRVLPEMGAKVHFLPERTPVDPRPVLTLPSSAVSARGAGWIVFKVEGGICQETPVRIGRTIGTSIEILDGIGAGDQVVLKPGADLASGTRVTTK